VHPLLTFHLRRMGIPFVLEMNTNFEKEYAAKGQAAKGRIYRVSEAMALRAANGWLTISEELRAYARRISKVDRPYLLAENGVDLEQVAPVPEMRATIRRSNGITPDHRVLLMSGFDRPWHGSDRAIEMLRHLPQSTRLWLVGAKGDAETRVRQLARSHGVDDRIQVFPWLDKPEVARLASGADLGLGALALDRNEMFQGQSIKTAFYLALGLPVLLCAPDPKIPRDASFASVVTSTAAAEIAEGVQRLLAIDHDPATIREFAVARLSWDAVARDTAEFMRTLPISDNRTV
jgi:glycosyltransferase involved in cell wall biosynthesis